MFVLLLAPSSRGVLIIELVGWTHVEQGLLLLFIIVRERSLHATSLEVLRTVGEAEANVLLLLVRSACSVKVLHFFAIKLTINR